MRLACSNAQSTKLRSRTCLSPTSAPTTILSPMKSFTRMARCIFRVGAGEQDVMALLKRAHVILFGDKRVYLRSGLRHSNGSAVHQLSSASGKDLLSPDCKTKFGLYKEGENITPIQTELEWSAVFIRKCLRNETITGFTTTAAHISTFTGMAVPEQDRKPHYAWAECIIQHNSIGCCYQA